MAAATMEAMDDQQRLLRLLDAKMSARLGSDVSELVMPSTKESKGWDRKLQRHEDMRAEYRAAREMIDEAAPNTLQKNERLWQATLLIFGESPYGIFSRANGMMYLRRSQYKIGDTSPVFTSASAERLLSIISHPFIYERSTSETLRLFLQFAVIARIGVRIGWTPPLANGESDCPILNSPVLDELRKEMSLVSKYNHYSIESISESIYERLVRLTKSHPESVEGLILAKVGDFAQARIQQSNQKNQVPQKELYNRQDIYAVSFDELHNVCLAIDHVASAKQEMSTGRALRAFEEANCRWLPTPSHKMPSLMKEVWGYEIYHRRFSELKKLYESFPQGMDNIDTTPSPESASDDSSEDQEPDRSNMTIERQITREVVVVDTEDVMNCCAAIDNVPRKSLAELWMDENPFEKQSERGK